MDMDGLCVLAADRGGACGKVRPLTADHDVVLAVAESHLRVGEFPLMIGDHHGTLEAESLLQPVQGRKRVFVENRRTEGRAFVKIFHDQNLPSSKGNIQVSVKST